LATVFQIPWRLIQIYRLKTDRESLNFPWPWLIVTIITVAVLGQWAVGLTMQVLG